MLDPTNVPSVDPNESLARFILYSGWIRSSDRQVKQDAFIPHPHVELSLTRLREATSEELWSEGERIARLRGRTLYGRADVEAADFLEQGIAVEAAPIQANPNHANATHWPADKPQQKIKALEIARKSRFISAPA